MNNYKHLSDKKVRKIANDPTKHYPNKNEAKLLRSIMAETGLNEDEVRSDRHFNVLLSEAQKQGVKPKHTAEQKYYHDKIKDACKQTGFVPQHPDTLKVLNELLKEENGFNRHLIKRYNLDALSVVKIYSK